MCDSRISTSSQTVSISIEVGSLAWVLCSLMMLFVASLRHHAAKLAVSALAAYNSLFTVNNMEGKKCFI